MTNADWFATYYGERYADSVREMLTPERSEREAEFILRETGLFQPARILDLACGEGRHALAFARQGHNVTGIDRNAEWIARAQAAARGLGAQFIVGDMREAQDGPFDLITVLFHSFGFFSDQENANLVRDWAARLHGSGWFVVDVWNREAILRHWQSPREWSASDDLHVREESQFDLSSGRLAIHYTYTYAHGARHEYDASFRLYTYTELRDLLARVGLSIVSSFGSLDGDPYALDSRRLVVFARTS